MSDVRMPRRKPRSYPWGGLATVPPDPRRKSPNLLVYGQESRYAPLEVFCCNGCFTKGRTRPDDKGCRHTDWFSEQLRPWWRARMRVTLGRYEQEAAADGR
jgi:hypothetical protein